jgi:folate-binding protein YgfZ
VALGVGEGGDELGPDRTLALETGLDLLNGVSFTKGCYIGQEVTTRMHNRKLVKKRIMPVAIEGPAPAPGTPVMLGVADAGELRAVQDGVGLALLRLDSVAEAAKGAALTAGSARVVPKPAEWMKTPG